jgi:hypothetical protein
MGNEGKFDVNAFNFKVMNPSISYLDSKISIAEAEKLAKMPIISKHIMDRILPKSIVRTNVHNFFFRKSIHCKIKLIPI